MSDRTTIRRACPDGWLAVIPWRVPLFDGLGTTLQKAHRFESVQTQLTSRSIGVGRRSNEPAPERVLPLSAQSEMELDLRPGAKSDPYR